MTLTKHEQIELVQKIKEQVGSLGDYLFLDGDEQANSSIETIENSLAVLLNSFYDENTYVRIIYPEDGDVKTKYFEENDIGAVCLYAARLYCFDDIDTSYEIDEIVCGGRLLSYVGWQPGMLFEFKDVESGEIVYSAEFPNWEH